MKSRILSIGAALLIVICGCDMDQKKTPASLVNTSVRTSFNPSVKFPKGSKYAFVQFASGQTQDSQAAIIDQRIRTALSGELKKKGYKPGEYEGIDFFVVYALDIQQEMDVLVARSKVQGNEWIAAIATPNDYVNGALAVQVIDSKSLSPVWLGVFNADVVLAETSDKEKQHRVNYAVSELLKQFPPK